MGGGIAQVLAIAGFRVVVTDADAETTRRQLERIRQEARAFEDQGLFDPGSTDLVEANIRAGEPLTGADVARAYAQRTSLSETMRLFFGEHDVLLLPTSQVPPFPVEQEFPETINGQEMPDYLAWMRSAYFITVTGCPAISVPAGRTADGLPVGVQLVARHGADRRLLEVAAAVEELLAG